MIIIRIRRTTLRKAGYTLMCLGFVGAAGVTGSYECDTSASLWPYVIRALICGGIMLLGDKLREVGERE